MAQYVLDGNVTAAIDNVTIKNCSSLEISNSNAVVKAPTTTAKLIASGYKTVANNNTDPVWICGGTDGAEPAVKTVNYLKNYANTNLKLIIKLSHVATNNNCFWNLKMINAQGNPFTEQQYIDRTFPDYSQANGDQGAPQLFWRAFVPDRAEAYKGCCQIDLNIQNNGQGSNNINGLMMMHSNGWSIKSTLTDAIKAAVTHGTFFDAVATGPVINLTLEPASANHTGYELSWKLFAL